MNRPEPDVAGGQELTILVCSPGYQAKAVSFQRGAIDQVIGHVADQQVAMILLRPGIAAVDSDPSGTGKEAKRFTTLIGATKLACAAQLSSQGPPRFWWADPKEPSELAIRRDISCHCGSL